MQKWGKRWVKRAVDTMKEDSIDLAPNINRNVLRNLKYEGEHLSMILKASTEQAPAEQESKDTNTDEQGMKEVDAIMKLMQPALDASKTAGTKNQKSSLVRYWVM